MLLPGRVLFVSYFIAMGLSHLLHFQQHSLVLKRKHVPLPRAATLLTILMMVTGGILVLFEWYTSCLLYTSIDLPAPSVRYRTERENSIVSRHARLSGLCAATAAP